MKTLQKSNSLPVINSYEDLVNFNNSLPMLPKVLHIEEVCVI